MMLVDKIFDDFPNGQIFAKGEIEDNPLGVNMSNSDKMLKWIAKKGYADDWCIYVHWSESGFDFVESNGDKVISKDNIQRLIPCTENVFKKYRY